MCFFSSISVFIDKSILDYQFFLIYNNDVGKSANYLYKNIVLNDYEDLVDDIRLISRAVYLFSQGNNLDHPIIQKALEKAKIYYFDPLKVITTNKLKSSGLIKYPFQDPIFEAIRINNAYYSRKRRLQKHLKGMFKRGKCVFLTLTFRADVLDNTSFSSRRQYVHRFLKSISSDYVANADFGEQKGREHYHAIVRVDWYDPGTWPYGFDFVEFCNNTIYDEIRLSKYVSKLTNHAYKDSAKRFSIIYSRNT